MKNGRDESLFMSHRNNGSLYVVTQNSLTLGEVEQLLQDTSNNGFPVVVSHASQYLVGLVARRDLVGAFFFFKKINLFSVLFSSILIKWSPPEEKKCTIFFLLVGAFFFFWGVHFFFLGGSFLSGWFIFI